MHTLHRTSLAGLALLVSSCAQRLSFGETDTAPLGSFEKLDAHLLAKKLTREVREIRPTETDAEATPLGKSGGRRYGYLDNSIPGLLQVVYVFVDPSKRVVAVHARCRTDEVAFASSMYRIPKFVGQYWTLLAKTEPTFAESRGVPIGKSQRRAQLEGIPGIAGTWTKDIFAGGMHDKVIDEIRIWAR